MWYVVYGYQHEPTQLRFRRNFSLFYGIIFLFKYNLAKFNLKTLIQISTINFFFPNWINFFEPNPLIYQLILSVRSPYFKILTIFNRKNIYDSNQLLLVLWADIYAYVSRPSADTSTFVWETNLRVTCLERFEQNEASGVGLGAI